MYNTPAVTHLSRKPKALASARQGWRPSKYSFSPSICDNAARFSSIRKLMSASECRPSPCIQHTCGEAQAGLLAVSSLTGNPWCASIACRAHCTQRTILLITVPTKAYKGPSEMLDALP